MDLGLVRRILRTWARDAEAFAGVLAAQDPSWGTETFELAGGSAVLHGRGLYVNRVLAAGFDRPFTGTELDRLEDRCRASGLPAAVEVGPVTHPDVVGELDRRGYRPDDRDTALTRHLDDLDDLPAVAPWIVIETAIGDLLPLWQETAAIGWGHDEPEARRASDAFARAAAVVDRDGFVVARAADDGRPLGCASLTVRDGIATLGGMSTVPTERRRGVQAELIRHRLRLSRELGCDLATSTAVPGGESERNLIRHGFTPEFEVTCWTRVDLSRR